MAYVALWYCNFQNKGFDYLGKGKIPNDIICISIIVSFGFKILDIPQISDPFLS